jgi:hypothetical protein
MKKNVYNNHNIYCHSPTQPQHELGVNLIMGRNLAHIGSRK